MTYILGDQDSFYTMNNLTVFIADWKRVAHIWGMKWIEWFPRASVKSIYVTLSL